MRSKEKKRADIHVHCRGEEQSYKTTPLEVIELALNYGIEWVADMPNSARPVINEKRLLERRALIPKKYHKHFKQWMGLTADESQLEEFVKCYNKYDFLIGGKLYAGKSVGDLEITKEKEQINIYKKLAELNYKGVIAVHCEKEKYIKKNRNKKQKFDPNKPISHCYARPKKAEIMSVKDQIKFSQKTGFKGTLHICHVSCHESVKLIDKYRKKGMKITCGATPHHILFDNSMMKEKDGLKYKMNPPLRSERDVIKLRKDIKAGLINWIETDHAVHAKKEKINPPYLSGYPSLDLYKALVETYLPLVMKMDETAIDNMTYNNIYRVFKNKLKK